MYVCLSIADEDKHCCGIDQMIEPLSAERLSSSRMLVTVG